MLIQTRKTRGMCVWAYQSLLFAASLLYMPYMAAQYGTRSGDWPSYGGDTGSTKY